MENLSGERGPSEGGLTIRDAVALLRRRRWIVLTCVLLVPLSAVFFSLAQKAEYQGKAEVLLSRQNLANSLTGTPDPNAQANDGDRIAQTQAKLATVPTVASRTLRALKLKDRNAAGLLDRTEVTTEQNSDILVFSVNDTDKKLAANLANEYALQYTLYRAEIDTAAVKRALDEVTKRIDTLERGGGRSTSLDRSLVDKQQQLRTIEALQTSNAFVVRREDNAKKVKPTPMRNAALGLVLGALLGVGLAFGRDALDTRLRTVEEISASLRLPLLARVPEARRGQAENGPVMLTDPHGPHGETYRVLRGNLEFSTLGREAGALMVTSAVEFEGKSTVIANLAAAWARGGRKVVLVDLDLRRPVLDGLFGLEGRPGVTNVALGQLSLAEACVHVPLVGGAGESSNGAAATATSGSAGSLDVLPCGAIPPDPGEFVGTEVLAGIIRELRSAYDLVLIDAPPTLRVGDPLTLSRYVDGIFVVSRIGVATSAMTKEFDRALSATTTPVLGVVVTGVGDGVAYGYGGAYGQAERPAEQTPVSDVSS